MLNVLYFRHSGFFFVFSSFVRPLSLSAFRCRFISLALIGSFLLRIFCLFWFYSWNEPDGFVLSLYSIFLIRSNIFTFDIRPLRCIRQRVRELENKESHRAIHTHIWSAYIVEWTNQLISSLSIGSMWSRTIAWSEKNKRKKKLYEE